jgi:hypothetical protein
MTFEDFRFSQIEKTTTGQLSVGQYRVMIEQNKSGLWVMQVIDKGSNFLTSKFTNTWDDEQSHPMTVEGVNQVLEKISRHSNDI